MIGFWYSTELSDLSELKNILKTVIEFSENHLNIDSKLGDLFFIKKELKQYMLKDIKQIYIIGDTHILLIVTTSNDEYSIFIKEFDEKLKKLIPRLIKDKLIYLKEEIPQLKIYKTKSKWKDSDIF